MVSVLTPIYRDEDATELNNKVEKLIDKYQTENEAINECFMALALNHEEGREKTFNEMSKTPEQCHMMVTYSGEQNLISEFISDLKNVIYTGYDETPLTEEKEHRMNKKEISEWLGTYVKPFILKGLTKQNAIGVELNVPGNTISNRVKVVYEMSWKEYVNNIKEGIY